MKRSNTSKFQSDFFDARSSTCRGLRAGCRYLSALTLALLAFATAVRAQAPLTNVTGTFLTPGGQTPAAAGLRAIATIGGASVYGTVDFTPLNSAANLPNAILCGGVTYIPQPVRGWISATGTLLNNAGAAGVNLVPNIGCQPAGLVTQARIAFAPSADGRIQSVVWIEQKQVPQTASVDWGSLSLASTIVPAFSYQLSNGGTINDYENFTAISAPANPATGFARVFFNSANNLFSCITSTGANCNPSGSGTPGGTNGQIQYNNSGAFGGFTLGGDCTFAVPNLTCTKTNGTAFAASATIDTTNAANISSGSLPLGRTPLTTLGDLLYTNATPALARLAGNTTATKNFLTQTGTGTGSAAPAWGAIAAGDIPAGAGCGANQYANALNSGLALGCAQVGFSQLSGSIALGQTPLTTRGDLLLVNSTPALARLGIGTSGQCLTSNGTDASWGACASGSGVTLQTNGTNNSSQTALNLQNSAPTNGLTLTHTNTSAGNVQLGLSGILTVPGGGTSLGTLTAHALYVGNGTSAPNPVAAGNAGQVLESNGGSADPTFQDPIVSYNYVNLFNAASATATQTSSTARVSTFGQYGELIVTWAGITGSPAGCTLQIKSADSLGNLTNNGGAVAVAPSNGTSAILFTPTIYTAAQMDAVYACTTYPTAGTLSLDFVPSVTVYSQQGAPGAQASPWWVRPTDGTNNMPMMDAAARAGFHKITDGTNTAAVKAGSTAAAAADPSLVVQISPNQPTFAVTANIGTTNGLALDASKCTGATGAAVPANGCYEAGNGSGNLVGKIVCDNTVIKNGLASSGMTLLVAAPGAGKNTYICGMAVNGASATLNTVKLVYGTHTTTDCDTGANDLSIAVPIQAPTSVAPAGQNVAPPPNVLWKTGATNNQVCANLSAAQVTNLQIWFTSF